MRRPRHSSVRVEEWPARTPFRIAGLSRDRFRVVVVQLADGTHVGQGEGLPVHYLGDTVEKMAKRIEAVRGAIEGGIDRHSLLTLLPPGGVRAMRSMPRCGISRRSPPARASGP
jgi:hypothetical protein